MLSLINHCKFNKDDHVHDIYYKYYSALGLLYKQLFNALNSHAVILHRFQASCCVFTTYYCILCSNFIINLSQAIREANSTI